MNSSPMEFGMDFVRRHHTITTSLTTHLQEHHSKHLDASHDDDDTSTISALSCLEMTDMMTLDPFDVDEEDCHHIIRAPSPSLVSLGASELDILPPSRRTARHSQSPHQNSSSFLPPLVSFKRPRHSSISSPKHVVPVDHSNGCTSSCQLTDLPDELICRIGSFLPVGSLKRARLANLQFKRLLSRDEAGWRLHCDRLWSRKIHVVQQSREITAAGRPTAMQAYQASCMDGRLRHEITRDELCFDSQSANPLAKNSGRGTIWNFRFKEAAGMEWTSFDPWHAGKQARKMVFLTDGTVKQLVLQEQSADSDKFCYKLEVPFSDATNNATGIEIRWKFVSQPMDLPRRNDGAYVRLTVGGRDVPTYIIHRSPNGNWGFLMENCWGVFASFQLPLMAPTRKSVRRRLRRASNGDLTWLLENEDSEDEDDEDDDEDDDAGSRHGFAGQREDIDRIQNDEDDTLMDQHRSKRRKLDVELLDDSSLTVTNRWQWREALLYNLGAATLPDGPTAVAEFDRAWEVSLRAV